MAEQFLLVKTYDFEADQNYVDLNNNTDGFKISYQGWVPQVTPDREGRIHEALSLRVNGTALDHIATNLQKLADKAEETRMFHNDGVENYAVWFRVQLAGETNGRQSLVYEIQHEPASSALDYSLRRYNHWNNYTLGITRAPWWEGTAIGTVSASNVSMFGGAFSYGTVHGDLPARLARVKFQPGTVPGGSCEIWPFGQFWLGFRSNRYYGTPSAWVSWYNLPSGRGMSGTADSENGAIGGTALVSAAAGTAAFGTGILTYATMGEISGGTPAAMYGSFLVLLRARVYYDNALSDWTSASQLIFNVRLVTGFWQDGYLAGGIISMGDYRPRVPVFAGPENDINWRGGYHFYELGEVNFPPPGRDKNVYGWNNYTLFLEGNAPIRTSELGGSAYLYVDGLALIPTEGLYWGGRRPNTATSDSFSNVAGSIVYWGMNGPDDKQHALVSGTAVGSLVYGANQPFYRNGVPPGSGIAVLAADNHIGYWSDPAWVGSVQIETIERWKEIRGND